MRAIDAASVSGATSIAVSEQASPAVIVAESIVLERSRLTTWGETYVQRFAVADFPVVFTRDAFDPANPTLVDALTRLEVGKRHRLAIFVDSGVQAAMPSARSCYRPLCGSAFKRDRDRG